tara:strand:- start:1007 stop:1300 length:294 start_codon:yes stop_codon:yes gene_type:complete
MHPWLNWIEHLTTDQKVAGSNPAGCTNYLENFMPQKQPKKSFLSKNKITMFALSFILYFGYLMFDGVSNAEETVYCYECKAYFPISQAAAHKTEPIE